MIKCIVNEKERTVTAKFISNKAKDTDMDVWLECIVDGVFKSVAETKECLDVFLTDEIVYPRVKKFLECAKLSNEFYYGIAKCNKIYTFDVKKGTYLAKKRLLKKYYKILNDVLLSLIHDMNIPVSIPFEVCKDSIKRVNDISDEIHFFEKYGIMLDDYITEAQSKEVRSKDSMNNNNRESKQDNDKKQLVFDNIKIEVKDFVVSTTVSDGRNAYVYRLKCKDYSPESLHHVIVESIRLAKNIMKRRFPMYNDLYYTVDFASNDLVSVGKWRAHTKEIILRDNGLIFKTKDEAVAVAKKMLEVAQKRKD